MNTPQTEWNPRGAETTEDLMNILLAAASGLKTQVITSPALNAPGLEQVRSRISEIANELHGMQHDVAFNTLAGSPSFHGEGN